jgi:hypothetical protein
VAFHVFNTHHDFNYFSWRNSSVHHDFLHSQPSRSSYAHLYAHAVLLLEKKYCMLIIIWYPSAFSQLGLWSKDI